MERPCLNRTPISSRGILTDDRNDDPALAGPLIEITQYDLLPGAQGKRSGNDREAFRGANQRAAQVRVAVLIPPAGVMGVVAVRRGDLIECALEIGDASRFKFQRGDAERRTDAGDIRVRS